MEGIQRRFRVWRPTSSRSSLVVPLFSCLLAVVSFAGNVGGQTCTGTSCDLGGQLRFQVGNGLPLPITLTSPQTGLITSHPGGIAAVPGATIMQTTGPAPRALTLQSARFAYDGPRLQIPIFLAAPIVLSVVSDLAFEHPAPGQTAMFSAGGRTGPTTVTWCIGSPLATASFNPGCLGPATTASGGAPVSNGLVRYVATRSQFGGTLTGRITGTAQVYFNINNLTLGQLPCPGGPGCIVLVSPATPPSDAAQGGAFGQVVARAFTAVVRTASIAANGEVLQLGQTVTTVPGQSVTSWGVPFTTGMLTVSVTANLGPADEVFVRTGVDGRNESGSGIVTLVAGGLSRRSLSGPNGNRAVATLRIPEPRALVTGSSILLLLLAGRRALRTASGSRGCAPRAITRKDLAGHAERIAERIPTRPKD